MKFIRREFDLLKYLFKKETPVDIKKIGEETGYDQSLIYASAQLLEKKGYVKIITEKVDILKLKKAGEILIKRGLPERELLKLIKIRGGKATLTSVSKDLEAPQEAFRWALKKGLIKKIQGNTIEITQKGENFLREKDEDEKLLEIFRDKSSVDLKVVKGINLKEAISSLRARDRAVELKFKVKRELALTEEGLSLLREGIEPIEEVTQLTSELITSGKWKEVSFKHYDVNLPTVSFYPGKLHPFVQIITQARKAFLEMGFEEISSPHVESSFWDFDALFQPQDHPAREMQDTFYLKTPCKTSLPDAEFVRKIKSVHRDGWKTGSKGWGYKWDEEEAKKLVLRTHTTAVTIRYLAKHPHPPKKVFTVGKIFRREKITYKHLPEFYQVDGIIIDKNATFASLLGTLKEFYRKMGIKEIRFKPAYFPYTEPSVEVYAKFKESGEIELGGAGIFRPEVTIPCGCQVPVLAWGLGLERLAMLKLRVEDVRILYQPDLNWLRNIPQCLS